jgi:archaeal preflagellin peptidase FlaK
MNIILLSDLILTSIAIIWLIAASVTDIKKREVADWLSYSLIAVAVATKTIISIITGNFHYLLYSVIGLACFLVLALVLYYSKVVGGGDAKLLIALGACFALKPLFAISNLGVINQFYNEPFLVTFIINLLFIGAVYGILFSIGIAIKNKKRFAKEYQNSEKTSFKYVYFSMAIILLVFALILKAYNLIILTVIFGFLPYLFSIVKTSEKLMIVPKSWKELTPGDWLAQTVKIKNQTLKLTADGLTKKDILLIKKSDKKVLIKDGVPFVPAILIALLISLFIGNILLLIVA